VLIILLLALCFVLLLLLLLLLSLLLPLSMLPLLLLPGDSHVLSGDKKGQVAVWNFMQVRGKRV
jgi:hypothetical protein